MLKKESAKIAIAICCAMAISAYAETAPDEHSQHHPGGPPAGAGPSIGNPKSEVPGAPAGMGPGMGNMGDMMKNMGLPKPKDFYPSLMDLPTLSPEQRQEAQAKAHERMKHGSALMNEGLTALSDTAATDNFSGMQQATDKLREGLATFETGLAAHRALAEGKAPRNVALDWFKHEMNLLPPASVGEGVHGIFGISWFHAFVMVLLSVFTVVMIGMYFRKMQRAALLLQTLTSSTPPMAAAALAISPSVVPARVPAAQNAAPPAPVIPAPQTTSSVSLQKWSGKLRVGGIFQETPNVKTFRLMNPLGGVLPFSYFPGQYLTITATIDGKTIKRSYTIASSPTQHDFAEITVKHEEPGVVSRYLHESIRQGDLLDCAGPAGSFIFTGREAKSVVFIGGGVGITPLMSITRYLTDRCWPGDIFFLYACRSPADFIFREELDHLQRRYPNLCVVATMSRAEGTDWKGARGRVTKEWIAESVPEIGSRRVHICGPVAMMDAVKKMLAELGVPGEQIKTELFGPALGKPEPVATAPAATRPEEKRAAVALPTVNFSRSDKTAPLPPDKSILEVADELGVEIDNSCRVGTCGTCKVKLLSGKVTMAVEESLDPEEKARGVILACQAKSTSNVVVEA